MPSEGGVVLDLGRPGDDLWARSGAAADGPAPEGGTASSASAKVPPGRLVQRRPGTPTKRHSTPPDLHRILGGEIRRHLVMPQPTD
jgi:hypothetical protein